MRTARHPCSTRPMRSRWRSIGGCRGRLPTGLGMAIATVGRTGCRSTPGGASPMIVPVAGPVDAATTTSVRSSRPGSRPRTRTLSSPITISYSRTSGSAAAWCCLTPLRPSTSSTRRTTSRRRRGRTSRSRRGSRRPTSGSRNSSAAWKPWRDASTIRGNCNGPANGWPTRPVTCAINSLTWSGCSATCRSRRVTRGRRSTASRAATCRSRSRTWRDLWARPSAAWRRFSTSCGRASTRRSTVTWSGTTPSRRKPGCRPSASSPAVPRAARASSRTTAATTNHPRRGGHLAGHSTPATTSS